MRLVAARSLPSALDSQRLAEWIPRVRQRGSIFLDYDGTLTPIVARPELAVLSETARAVVRSLAASWPVTVVSGRDRAVVRDLVGVDQLGYVGSHGLDIAGPSMLPVRHEVGVERLPDLDAAEAMLRAKLNDVDGVLVERKRFSVATHVRQVDPTRHQHVKDVVDLVQRAHPLLRREDGKQVHEIRPDVAWDKGAAVRWLLEHMQRPTGGALYVGDDLTDETAFVALGREGTTIVVANDDDERPTAARYRVENPAEVLDVLRQLAVAAGRD